MLLPLSSTRYVCLVMNVVPHRNISSSRGHRVSNGEDQPTFERQLQQSEHFGPFSVVWQIGDPSGGPIGQSGTDMALLKF